MSHPSPAIGQPFVNVLATGSTNDEARIAIKDGRATPGMVIFTTEQKAGRGQRGRSWKSEKDASIAMSALIRPDFLTVSQQFSLSMAVALAAQDLLSTYAGSDDIRIKWPNDIYWRDRKLSGILIESVISSSGQWQWAVVGIGVNVNQPSFPSELPNPVSLRQITGKQFDCEKLARELCLLLTIRLRQLQEKESTALLEDYNQKLYKKGSACHFIKNDQPIQAIVGSVTITGELILEELADPIRFGEIEWVVPRI